MGGKASVLLVLSFSLIFLLFGYRFNVLSTNSVENSIDYYIETKAHNIAVSGANMAANKLFMDSEWNSGFSNLSYNGGLINLTVTEDDDEREIISQGTYNGLTHIVRINLKQSNFSKFAYYMNLFGGGDEFTTGDTVWGPFHTNGKLTTVGSPVFMGKASAKLGIKMFAPKDPKFYGGFESGVDIPFEFDTTGIMTAAVSDGKFFSGSKTDVRLIFNDDATVTYSTKESSSSTWTPDSTESLSTFAPNGVIWNAKGNLYLSGTVNGQYTIGVGLSSGVGSGNIHIEDDLVYRSDPIDDPDCTDMLGLIAGNNLVIDDTPANHNDVNIHASIFAAKGGLSVEDLNSFPPAGELYLAGGIAGYQNQSFSTHSGGVLTHGFNLKLKYDERFMVTSPPKFPVTNTFEIVSWYE